jgi:hypothetical protein
MPSCCWVIVDVLVVVDFVTVDAKVPVYLVIGMIVSEYNVDINIVYKIQWSSLDMSNFFRYEIMIRNNK